VPRIADHPRASLERTLELAAAVEELGGECSLEAAADRLGATPGGAFGALVSTAAKYGWLAIRRGRLRTEPRYRSYRLAYDEAERRTLLLDAMRNVPVFLRLLERFGGRTLPEERLAKLLVREFDVPESAAARVAGWFVDGATAAGLLAGGQLRSSPTGEPDSGRRTAGLRVTAEEARGASYTIRVSGPGLDSTLTVNEPADLELVRSLLAKVERALRAGGRQ
jgi:hypothetical protein